MHLLETLLGPAASGAVVIALARMFVTKSFKELEQVVGKISELKEQLAVIAVRLESAEKASELLQKHDRKIAAMEQVVYGNRREKKSAAWACPD